MTLRERLQDDTTAAMRSGDALRRDVLRMVQNAIYNADKAKHTTMSDDEIVGVITREVKTRRESVEAFTKGGRDDLVAKEEAEIAILRDYLPEAALRRRARRRSSTRASRRPAPPRPATSARSWAGSPRGSAAARTARSPPVSSPRRWRALTCPRTIRGTDPPTRRSTPCSPHQPSPTTQFTRRDAGRLIAASALLIVAMSVILGHRLPARPAASRGRQARARARPGAACRRVHERRPHQAAARCRERGDRAAVRLHVGGCGGGRRPAAARARHEGRARRRGVRRRRQARGPPRDPQERPAGPVHGRTDHAPGPHRRPLDGRPQRGGAGPRDRRARRAPRQPGRVDQRVDRRAHGRRPQRRRARPRRRPHRAADRPELVVLRRPHEPGQGQGAPRTSSRSSRAGSGARPSSGSVTAWTTWRSRPSTTSASTRGASTSPGWSGSSCSRSSSSASCSPGPGGSGASSGTATTSCCCSACCCCSRCSRSS